MDNEEERFLAFEKWWGGFFLMTDREIHQIVDGLFVGNKLERGEFELEAGRRVDLKRNDNPVVVFASFGDNITPPQQAFNWIVKAYGTVEEIKRRGQVIVCIRHSAIGHLGIFVSAKIARKEHREIIASFDMLAYLPPGLYEMQIEKDPERDGEYAVSYTEKTMEDILAMDDGFEDEKAFLAVRQVSELFDRCYRTCLSPWIRAFSSELAAEAVRQLHPLRQQRYLMSDLNPWMIPVKQAAAGLRENGQRRPVADDNPFLAWERLVSDMIVDGLEAYRNARDAAWQTLFKTVYESPWMKLMAAIGGAVAPRDDRQLEDLRRRDAERWRRHMATGDFADAMVRMLLLVGFADQVVHRDGYAAVGRLLARHPRTAELAPEDLRQIVREQSRIIQTDMDQAITSLPCLLATAGERREARALLDQAAAAIGRDLTPRETLVLENIQAALGAITIV